ncbi:MAG: hypothetical protein JW909_06485 [Planctomycetes bacterium]|nr:hypothetical protein [Planctomycetota bacterium]
MLSKRFFLILLTCSALSSMGCITKLSTAYWMPGFETETASGAGSDMVNVKNDFGVETDSGILAFDVMGETSGQRIHLSYWKITGDGTAVIGPGGIDFADYTYSAGDQTSTTLDLTNIGVVYEPALVKKPRFDLRLLIGANLVNFNMVATDVTSPAPPGDGEVHLPADGSDFESIGYLPVPLVGAGFDIIFTNWISLSLRAQMFDTSYVGLEDTADATFLGGEVGLYFGRPKLHVQGFVGYRYFHTEYTVDDDSGDSTLDGITGGVFLTF